MGGLEYVEKVLRIPDGSERCARLLSDPRLHELLPELYLLAGVPQPLRYHPEGDAFEHTLQALRCLEPDCDRRVAWGVLLHDIGKALTTRIVRGVPRSPGHEKEGARMAGDLLARLGMESSCRVDVVWLVENHMFPLHWRVRCHDDLSRRHWRLIGDDRFPLLLEVVQVDALASGGGGEKLDEVDFYLEARELWERGEAQR